MFRYLFLLALFILTLTGCDVVQSLLPTPPAPETPVNTLVYDAPVSLTIRSGTLLPGTTIAYAGKTATGAAKVMMTGLEAPKQTGDTLDWSGSPAPNAQVKLTTRVVTFDEQSISVAGTAHIELANIVVQPGGTPGSVLMEFNAPVTYTLTKDQKMPGSNVGFVGVTAEGAQFSGLSGVPYRKELDSLEYNGRLLPKVFLRLNMRVIRFTGEGAVLGGTANIKVEAP